MNENQFTHYQREVVADFLLYANYQDSKLKRESNTVCLKDNCGYSDDFLLYALKTLARDRKPKGLKLYREMKATFPNEEWY